MERRSIAVTTDGELSEIIRELENRPDVESDEVQEQLNLYRGVYKYAEELEKYDRDAFCFGIILCASLIFFTLTPILILRECDMI